MANNTSNDELTLEDLVAFLCGEKSLSGRWYGEKYEGEPTFWWRPKLRQLICEREEQATREARLQDLKYIKSSFANLQDGSEAIYIESNIIDPLIAQLTTTHKGDK